MKNQIQFVLLFLLLNYVINSKIFNKENGLYCSSNLECQHSCCKNHECVDNVKCKNDKYILYYIDGGFCVIFILSVFVYGHFRIKKINANVKEYKEERIRLEEYEKRQKENEQKQEMINN
jgi:hypothetical protein